MRPPITILLTFLVSLSPTAVRAQETAPPETAGLVLNNHNNFSIQMGERVYYNAFAYEMLGADQLAIRYDRRSKVRPWLRTGGLLTAAAAAAGGFVWLMAGFGGYDQSDWWIPTGAVLGGALVVGVGVGGYGLLMSLHPIEAPERIELVQKFNSRIR